MNRFIYFIVFIIGIISIFSLKNLDYKVNNTKFVYSKAEADFNNKQKELYELTHKKHEVKTEHVKAAGPLVELTTESLKNGHALYKKCSICHGKTGAGKKAQKAPAIGGQLDWYIKKQITDMKSGYRVNVLMNPYVKKLSESDINDLAEYISKLPWKEK